MPVTEVHRALGDWSVSLRPDTPKSVRDQIGALGHIVIVPAAGPPPETQTDASILASARYTGVLLRGAGTFDLGGPGLAWWLGDADGNGMAITSPISGASATLSAWIAQLRGPALVAGTVGAIGSVSGTFVRVSRRQAIDAVCDAVNATWRIRPNFALDADTQAVLFGATPTTIAVRGDGGSDDLHIRGFQGDLTLTVDHTEHTTQLVLIAAGGVGTAGGASATFRDGQGNLVTLTRIVEAPDVPPGSEASAAANLLNIWSSTAGRRSIALSSQRYDLREIIEPGGLIWCYDPELGLVDLTNQRYHAGQPVWPVALTVQSISWPIEEGMGVYYRGRTGTGATQFFYVDLTPYVLFEGPGASVEVGGLARPDLGIGERPSSVSTAQVESGAWTTYTPTLTNGTGTVVGGWRREGTSLHIRGQLTLGTITGNLSVSLPAGVTAVSAQDQVINATALDTATARYRAQGIVVASGTTIVFQASDSAALVNATSPFTWGAGDVLSWTGTIEVQ